MISEEEKQDLLGGAYEQGVDDGYMAGDKIGLEKGRVEGCHARSEEIARKMKEMGLSSEQIKQATGIEL